MVPGHRPGRGRGGNCRITWAPSGAAGPGGTRVNSTDDAPAGGAMPLTRSSRTASPAFPAGSRHPWPGFPAAPAAAAGVESRHGGDHVLGHRGQVDLGRAQPGMTHNPLDVGQRHLRIPRHPVGSGVPQVVQRPALPERVPGPGEHAQCRVIGQLPERPPQGPPQRLVRSRRDQAPHLLLVKPQPHERVRRRRKLLHRPRPLADDRDQLPPRIGIGGRRPQQLRRAGTSRDPERDQRPVPVRAEPGEQLAELLVGDAARGPLRKPRPEQPGPAPRERLHRITVRPGTTAPAAVQRERIHHRAGPRLEMEIVKVPQHRLAVRDRRRRVPASRPGPPGDQQPPAEIAGLRPGHLIPLQPRGPAKPEPPQQVHPIRPKRRLRPPARLHVLQVLGRRPDHRTRRVSQLKRRPRIARLPEPARQRNRKPRHVQALLVIGHEQGP